MAISPPTQKHAQKPIAFLLDTGTGGLSADYVNLYIRPEELTVTSPSRVSVHQTMGEFWVDSYGAGVKRITISGTTGWHSDNGLFGVKGGIERFKELQNVVFDNFFKTRKTRLESGLDPSTVKVIFIDRLNDICSSVVPVTFTLKRSKSRPLLVQYNIVFDVVEAEADKSYITILDGLLSLGNLGALGSLSASIASISGLSNGLSLSSGLSCATEVAKFGTTCVGIYNSVNNTFKNGGALSGIMSVASVATSSFGANVCQSIATAIGADPTLTKTALSTMASYMKLASCFGNVYCLLKNAFKNALKSTDYSSILGASFCSSTSGGTSLSQYVTEGASVFDSIFGTNVSTGTISFSSDALKTLDLNGIGSTGLSNVTNGTVTSSITDVASSVASGSASAINNVISIAGETIGTVNNGLFVPDSIKNSSSTSTKILTLTGD